MPGIKGKRIPGRPGRFDPTEPLHMTTRRAAKITTTNGSPSLNGSIGDDDSRRGSLDDSRPFTSYSTGSQFSLKSHRLSDASMSGISPDLPMNGTSPPEQMTLGSGEPKPLSPILNPASQSPSRKRKRSSSPGQPLTPPQHDTTAETSFENYDDVPMYDDENDTVDVIRAEDLSDREVPASQATSASEEYGTESNAALLAPSIDATPALSGAISPVTNDSTSPDGDAANAKQLGAALEVARAQQYAEYDQDDGDENEITVEAGQDLDDADADDGDGDEQVRSDDDGRPRKGRFGGRRRAKHQIPKVEAAMQRQSEIKSAYRAIARAQKAVLAALAQRTIENLETDPNLHLHASEHEDVISGLDRAFAERKRRLHAQHEYNVKLLQQTLADEEKVINAQRDQQCAMLKDECLSQLEYQTVHIARRAQLDHDDGGDETEDEDDVVPRPKGMGYRFQRSHALDNVYDSRSRQVLETERAVDDMQRRFAMQQFLDSLPAEYKLDSADGFTFGNSDRRAVAVEKRNSILNTKTLADAAVEIERREAAERAKIPVIPNEQAFGLQMLGDLAQRPSIIGSGPPLERAKHNTDAYIGQTPPRQPPPHLQLQTQNGPSRIPVQMSPRTTQALNDRFDHPHPLPSTPGQTAPALIRSPEATRKEFHLQSAHENEFRAGNFGPPSAKRLEGRPPAQRGSMEDRQPHRPPFGPSPFRFGEDRARGSFSKGFLDDRNPPRERRESQDEEKPRFDFLSRVGKPTTGVPSTYDKIRDPEQPKTEPRDPFNFLYNRHNERSDAASRAGASDARNQILASPDGPTRRATLDLGQSPASRHASFFRHEDEKPDVRGFKRERQHKPNKAERGGIPRRQWSTMKIEREFSGKPLSKPGPASAISPSLPSPSFAGNPYDRGAPPGSYQPTAPPLQSPLGPPPPSAFGQGPPFGRPPPPFAAGIRDMYQRRDSGPARPPASIWDQNPPPPSPGLYAIPGPHRPPPPPGVPNDQFHRLGAPPPPSGFQGSHPPQNLPPQSAPGSYPAQFGGQPLAPAMHPGFNPAFRPQSHGLPAFAQQAQQQQNQQQNSGSGHRRRTQSDASYPKFQNWQPPTGGRR
jgi:hypothetical protein